MPPLLTTLLSVVPSLRTSTPSLHIVTLEVQALLALWAPHHGTLSTDL
jgi:hypothetical protein